MATKTQKRKTKIFSAALWPRDAERIEQLRRHLVEEGPGSDMGFADVVKFLLSQDCVKKITDPDFANHGRT